MKGGACLFVRLKPRVALWTSGWIEANVFTGLHLGTFWVSAQSAGGGRSVRRFRHITSHLSSLMNLRVIVVEVAYVHLAQT